MFTIYCHTHRATGRRYVGQTSQGMRRRWNTHVAGSRFGEQGRFARALRKYGRDSFDHEVLDVVATENGANVAERAWIAHYQSSDPRFGFNIDLGGRDQRKFSEETKEKLRASALARWARTSDEERRAHMQHANAAMTPERRSRIGVARFEKLPPEERRFKNVDPSNQVVTEARREAARRNMQRANAMKTTEERAEVSRRYHAYPVCSHKRLGSLV